MNNIFQVRRHYDEAVAQAAAWRAINPACTLARLRERDAAYLKARYMTLKAENNAKFGRLSVATA